jgi:NAD(P)H-dependent FMN reductase
MTRIAIIIGSTRPRRRAGLVAEWVCQVAQRHQPDGREATFELVDLADYKLPLLDEPNPAVHGEYVNPQTRAWADTIASYDGFIFITPEYNHSMPAALKNAIDYLFAEWNDKAAGFVSYGLQGGTRATEHLRLALGEVKMACVRTHVALSLFTDFELTDMTQPGTIAPGEHQEPTLTRMLDEIVAWADALAPLRTPIDISACA